MGKGDGKEEGAQGKGRRWGLGLGSKAGQPPTAPHKEKSCGNRLSEGTSIPRACSTRPHPGGQRGLSVSLRVPQQWSGQEGVQRPQNNRENGQGHGNMIHSLEGQQRGVPPQGSAFHKDQHQGWPEDSGMSVPLPGLQSLGGIIANSMSTSGWWGGRSCQSRSRSPGRTGERRGEV